jgi:hypothetical protein
MEQLPPPDTNPDPEGYTQTPSHSPEQDEGLGFDPALPLEPQPTEEMNDLLNEQAAPEVISMNGLKRFVADRRARRLTRIEKKISDIRRGNAVLRYSAHSPLSSGRPIHPDGETEQMLQKRDKRYMEEHSTTYRPVTWGDRRHDKRVERRLAKNLRLATIKQMAELTYGQRISTNEPASLAERVSRKEARTARKVTNRVVHADKVMARHITKVRDSAANRDIAGKTGRYRLKRLQKKRKKILNKIR